MPAFFSTASISASARIAEDVEIGPYCVIEAGARVETGSRLMSHVVIKSGAVLGRNTTLHEGVVVHGDTSLGEHNTIHERCIIGGLPLVRSQAESCGRLEIGSHNTIRELSTIQRATVSDAATRIGDHNFIMPSCQIGHDSVLGDHVTITNYSAIAGHVTIEDHATLGIGVQVHQHCRIGAYAMVGASAYVPRDVPPFVTIDGQSGCVVGLNKVGLKRNGFSPEQISDIKRAYRTIYRMGLRYEEILTALDSEFQAGPAASFRPFLSANSRGFSRERRDSSVATIPLQAATAEVPPATIEFDRRCA